MNVPVEQARRFHVVEQQNGALAEGLARDGFDALLIVDLRSEGTREAAEQILEGADRADETALLAEEHQLEHEQRRHQNHRPGDVTRAEQAPHQDDHGERQADRAHQAKHREPEDAHGRQRAALLDRINAAYLQEKLFISEGTAKTHIRHIYGKTGVHSQQELMRLIDDTVVD